MSNWKKINLPGALAVMLLMAISAVISGCGGKDTCQYRLTYSIFFPPVHIQTRLAEEWAKEIEERSCGRVKIVIFSGGVLSGASENYDCVANGVSDIGMSCLSYSRGLFPLCEVLDLPMGYPDGQIATAVANDFIREFQPEELKDTRMLYLHAHGPGVLAANKKLQTLGDIKNLSIRGTGITAQIIRQLGGNAVGLPQGETYEALRKGVVDATLCPVETLKGWKQGEVISHVIRIPAIGYTTAMFVTMNNKTWNKLPPDIQDIITQVTQEWIPKHGKAWDQADKQGEVFVGEMGKNFSRFSATDNIAAAEKLQPLLEQWIQKTEAKGLPGRQAVDFVMDRIDFYKKQNTSAE